MREREKEKEAGDTRRSEKRNRLRGWKRQTDRPFVIRKLACSNCDRSVDCRSGGREKREAEGEAVWIGGEKAVGKRERG